MIYYIFIFLLTSVLALVHFNKPKISPWAFSALIIILALFVGVSDMLGGYDRYIYSDAFTAYAEDIQAGLGFFNEHFHMYFSHEPVYGIIMGIIGSLTLNRYIFICIVTALMYSLFGIAIYRNAKNPYWGLLLFEALLFFFTFAYIRQALAASICWMSIPYAFSRKRLPFFGIVILAALIHNSALYFLLLWFLPYKKYSPKAIVLFMFFLFVVGVSGLGANFFLVYGSTVESASTKAQMYADSATGMIRLEYILEAVLFLYILLRNYRLVGNDRHSLLLLNIYLMFCGVLFLFVRSTDGGRIAWYSIIGIISLLSDMADKKRLGHLRTLVWCVCFLLFFRIVFVWGYMLYPYKTFFSPGHRSGDIIYELYEYDTNYDRNKFYNL